MTQPGTANSSGLTEVDLDRLVREVLVRLQAAAASSSPAGAAGPQQSSSANGAVRPARPGESASGVLVASERLITAATIGDRLAGVRQLQAPEGAIVTPAARDLLRERGVRIEFAACAVSPQPPAAKGRFVCGLAQCEYDPAPLERWLRQRGHAVERIAATGLPSVVAEVADEVVKGGALGLVWTNRSAAALCLANRQRGVRAVLAVGPAYVAAAVASVGANVLVVEPAGHSPFAVRGMLAAFADAPRSTPPEIRVE